MKPDIYTNSDKNGITRKIEILPQLQMIYQTIFIFKKTLFNIFK